MDGLMMDYPLTIADVPSDESMFGHKEIVSRRPDRTDRTVELRFRR